MGMTLRFTFAGILAPTLFLSGCAMDSTSEPIVVAGIPFDDTQNVEESYEIFMDLVADATGREVEFYQASDYATVTEALLSGQVDIAQISAFSYILASSRSDDLDILGISGRNPTDPPGYFSYAIKRAGDTALNSIEDLRGKTICFSDPSSGAGYLWPAKYLAEAGINPDPLVTEDIKAVFAETFPQVALSVALGDCDAGFLLDVFWDRTLVDSDLVDISQLEKFWESNVSPGIPLVAKTSNFSEDELIALTKMFGERANKDYLVSAGICDDRQSCNFLSAAAWGYLPGEDSFYDELRDLCRELDLAQCRQ